MEEATSRKYIVWFSVAGWEAVCDAVVWAATVAGTGGTPVVQSVDSRSPRKIQPVFMVAGSDDPIQVNSVDVDTLCE